MESFDYYSWVILPLIIMFSRVADVTLGTMRIILVTKGYRKFAPIAGFFEVLIWIFVMTQIIKHVDNVVCYFAWATGFATGVYVGSYIENRIALGVVIIRMIISEGAENLIAGLKQGGFSVTYVEGTGSKGPVKVLYTVTQRKLQNTAVKIIREFNPNTLYTIEDLKSAHQDFLGSESSRKLQRAGKFK